jgi:hypothetical protein
VIHRRVKAGLSIFERQRAYQPVRHAHLAGPLGETPFARIDIDSETPAEWREKAERFGKEIIAQIG